MDPETSKQQKKQQPTTISKNRSENDQFSNIKNNKTKPINNKSDIEYKSNSRQSIMEKTNTDTVLSSSNILKGDNSKMLNKHVLLNNSANGPNNNHTNNNNATSSTSSNSNSTSTSKSGINGGGNSESNSNCGSNSKFDCNSGETATATMNACGASVSVNDSHNDDTDDDDDDDDDKSSRRRRESVQITMENLSTPSLEAEAVINANDCHVIFNGVANLEDIAGGSKSKANVADTSVPSTINSDDDVHSKRVLYNDFVNLLCDTDISGAAAAQHRINTGNAKRFDDCNERHEEIKPLLTDRTERKARPASIKTTKPKSIVKSPSTQTFGSTEKFCERKPRLSIQCTSSDPERPVLHVQFLQNNHEAEVSQSYPPQPAPLNGRNRNYDAISLDGDGRCTAGSIPSSVSSTSSSTDSSESSSDDEGSSVGFAEAKPPDGGWGWVVVFASFMVNLIADGITFSFGVIYVEFLNYFGEGKAKTAWIGSLFMAMPLLSGPVASFLTDRYGCRKVTIAGSILACIGFVISSFSESMEMLFFTFGILAGFGLSLCYVAAVVIVAYYFDKRRSFATGLSVCGSGIGTFIFAPLTQVLIDEYGWRGTTLILAGLFLNMTVCGMLMRDLEWTTYRAKLKAKQRKRRHKLGISAESFSVSNSTNTGGTASNNPNQQDSTGNGLDENGDSHAAHQSEDRGPDPRLYSSLITLPTFVKNGEKVPMEVLELLSTHKNIHHVLLQNYPGLAHSRSFSQPLASARHSNSGLPIDAAALSPTNPERSRERLKNRQIRNEQAFLSWLKEDENPHRSKDERGVLNRSQPTTSYLKDLRMHRHSLTYRGAMLNINRYRLRASSCPDIYRNSMTTIAKEKAQWAQGVAEFKAVVMDMLDFSYFADIRFLLFAVSNFFLYTWYDVPYVYLADNAIEMGFSETDASLLISLIGIVNMFGEIILGWFGDRKCITAGLIYAICMIFCGIVTGLVPLLKSYVGLSILSGLFGLFIAANYALTSIILVELITLDRFTNAYGLLLLVQGIANLVGPPLAGWITDVTGNYDISFYLAGFFISISGLLMLILPIYGKYKKYKELDRKGSDGPELDRDTENATSNIVIPKSALKTNGTTSNNWIGGKKAQANGAVKSTGTNKVNRV